MLTETNNHKLYNLGILQGRSYRILEEHLTALLRKHGLIIPEWKLLGLIYDTPHLKISDLSKKLDVEGPFITRLANSLEKKELITRKTKKEDLRTNLINITSKGETVIPEIEHEVKSLMDHLLTGTTQDDRYSYIVVMQKISDNGEKLKKLDMLT